VNLYDVMHRKCVKEQTPFPTSEPLATSNAKASETSSAFAK